MVLSPAERVRGGARRRRVAFRSTATPHRASRRTANLWLHFATTSDPTFAPPSSLLPCLGGGRLPPPRATWSSLVQSAGSFSTSEERRKGRQDLPQCPCILLGCYRRTKEPLPPAPDRLQVTSTCQRANPSLSPDPSRPSRRLLASRAFKSMRQQQQTVRELPELT